MNLLQNIVIGIDFSPFSMVALAQAKRIARWNQSDLHLIHVTDKYVLEELHKNMQQPMEEIEKHAREATDEKIQELFAEDPLEQRKEPPSSGPDQDDRRKRDKRRIELKPEVVIGDPFECIHEKIREVNADLLILGSNGSTDPKRGLGYLATKCVRKTVCRVLIVRGKEPQPFENIVAAVSFSPSASKMIEQAIHVAKQDHARLHLVHSYMPPWEILHYRSPTAACSPDFKIQFQENLLLELKHYLKDYKEEIESLEIKCELIEDKVPSDGIIEYSQNNGADLIVVGTRGRRGLTSQILGTQAERMLHHSTASALIMRPEDFDPS